MSEPANPVIIELVHDTRITYAMQQNGLAVVKLVRLFNSTPEPLDDLVVDVEVLPDLCPPVSVHIASIRPGQRYDVDAVPVTLPPERLVGLTERVTAALRCTVRQGDVVLGSHDSSLELLAYNQWPGTYVLPELVAAFVLPNHPDVGTLLRRAADLLGTETKDPSLDGYQSESSDRVRQAVRAVYCALQAADLTYVNPPASFETEGQKVRTPDQILRDRLGTCLDLSLLYAACLEQAGLHPLVLFTEGHALVGCWLTAEHFPEPTIVDDPRRLRKRIRLGTMIAVDVTALAARPSAAFELAESAGRERLEDPGATFVAVDVRAARLAGMRPVPPRSAESPFEYALAADVPIVEAPPPLPSRPAVPPPVESSPSKPMTRLDRWKDKLLDLSLRNRLLNFRPTKATVPLLCPALGPLEDALVEGTAFGVVPRTTHEGSVIAEAFAAGRLTADLTEAELGKRLTTIYRTARLSLEESGANTLYLALGMLHWFETPSSRQERQAPLLLLAVELRRLSAGGGYRLTLAEEEPLFNLTLAKKLETEFGIRMPGLDPLPVDEAGLDVPTILRTVREAVLAENRWEVRDSVHLGLFSFTKHLMWRDLEHRADDLRRNDVVRHLVDTPDVPFPSPEEFPAADTLDATVPPDQVLCPLDADSSQLGAVLAAERPSTFVLEGPPGTGKSQTITNLIAHALARGKRVLFVSEKMAALNVVYSRLGSIGLEPFCLELHSNKVNKQHVLDQLRLALEFGGPKTPTEWNARSAELTKLRDELNAVVEVFHRPRSFGESVYQVTARVVGLRSAPRLQLSFDGIAEIDADELAALRSVVVDLAETCRTVASPAAHPWAAVRRTDWLPSLPREVEFILKSLGESVPPLQAATTDLFRELRMSDERSDWQTLEAVEALARLLVDPPPVPTTLLDADTFAESVGMIRGWLEKGRRRLEVRTRLEQRYDVEGLLALALPNLLEQYRSWQHSNVLVRWVALYGARSRLSAVARSELGSVPETLGEIELALELHQLNKYFAVADAEGRRLLGDRWRNGEPDWDELAEHVRWAETFYEALARLPDADGDVCRGAARTGTMSERCRRFIDASSLHNDERLSLAECLDLDLQAAWGLPGAAGYFQTLTARLAAWNAAVPSLREWCPFVAVRRQAESVGLTVLVHALMTGELQVDDVQPAFERSFGEAWLEAVTTTDDRLRSFRGSTHERSIAKFRALDGEIRDLAARVVQAELAGRRPARSENAPETSELGILQRELKKQRRHRPVRWLLQNISTLLPRLCPCLLMSPLSVAQYLDASHPSFDLVVFDEASQIPVWDAVGAVARGRHLVVVGDSRQLPPTMFFTKTDGDEALTEDDVEELESVLDECTAAGLPRLYLEWHYRSRHESLIAFSNRHYYDSRLHTFPAARGRAAELGVEWRPVLDGRYARGGNQTNEPEAEALVAEVVRRLRDPELREHSIGVVTFSMAQQTLIEDLLDEARRRYPDIEPWFGSEVVEPVFVKNLENVQGDERAVMLFSICYGPDEHGRVAMNFGPLNRQGGERRLNVAVTRAREKLVVFSTLTADHIDLNRTAAVGVKHLRAFLEYAAHGPAGEAGDHAAGTLDTDEFADVLAATLEEAGLVVDRDVGCSDFRIPVAVRRSTNDDDYVLGVLTDGPVYRAAATARDRERLRSEVLERLGWRLHRVWSADWWLARDIERERLMAAVAEAMSAAPAVQVPVGEPAEPSTDSSVEAEPAPPERSAPPESEALPGAVPYVPWTVTRLGAATDFYADRSKAALVSALGEIVTCEAPITVTLATRRLAAAWEVTRVTKKTRAWVEELVECLAARHRPVVRDGVIWRHDQDPVAYTEFRVPADGEQPPRDADDIPTIELANAAERILQASIALPRESLIKETCRVFGFSRAGTKLKQAVEAALGQLEARGACRIDGSRLCLP